MIQRLAAFVRGGVFALVFYGGSFLFVLAALAAVPISRRFVIGTAIGWSRFHRLCVRVICGIRVRIEGHRAEGQVLYVLRHESFFEAIDLPTFIHGAPVPFAKAELMAIPLWGTVAARYGVVGVERAGGAATLRAMKRAASDALASGRTMALFPEGTRVAIGEAPPLKSGLYGIYRVLGLPVVPVAVDSGRLYHGFAKRPGVITYRIGETLPPGLDRPELEVRVHAAINALNPVAKSDT